MTDESFLLVSLDEEKSKALAQVLSNDTSRKILNYLSKVEHATETQISKELKIPLSTTHYNLGLLVKSNLITDENYSYSKKGKEIIHYTLSNKYVIIAPKNSEVLKEKLKNFLPVILISGIFTFGIKYFNNIYSSISNIFYIFFNHKKEMDVQKVIIESYNTMNTFAFKSNNILLKNQEFAFWFFIGCIFSLIVYLFWTELILPKIKKNKK